MTRRREPVLFDPSGINIPTPPIVHEMIPHRPTRQAIKFALVGAVVFVVDALVFLVLLGTPLAGLGQLGKQLGKAGSFIVAVATSYTLNRAWTFRSQDRDITTQATKFVLVASVGLVLNNGFFYVFNAQAFLGWSNLESLVGAALSVGLWNFVANKLWTFREKQ